MCSFLLVLEDLLLIKNILVLEGPLRSNELKHVKHTVRQSSHFDLGKWRQGMVLLIVKH